MQILALIWGLLAMAGLVVAFVPCLGSLNYLNIPFAVVGLIISIVAAANAPIGDRGTATAGIVLNALAIALGAIRLVIGFGVL